MLFHVSEESQLTRFEPRSTDSFHAPVVWAIDAEHLRNYLLPRDCPRVTYYRTSASSGSDVTEFLGGSRAVVAIERAWLDRVRMCELFVYHLPPATFQCLDAGAGYFVSEQAVEASGVDRIPDLARAIADRDGTLRILDNLWSLHDAVAASTLQFSMIRMRNAQPRSHVR